MRVILIAAAVVALAGCSSQGQFTPRPVGIGGSPNALKRTPCAGGCGEVKQKPGMPAHLMGATQKAAA